MANIVHISDSLLKVDVQFALDDSDYDEKEEPPSSTLLAHWAETTYHILVKEALRSGNNEVTLRIVNESEIRQLNRDYRHQDKPTNVLSFPYEADINIGLSLLGDVVLCHSVIVREALEHNKGIHDHYAHMVTHGVLHLCGYDHQDDLQAQQMEALEVTILAQSDIANPYLN